MSKLREAAQQVVDEHEAGFVGLSLDKAVAALRAALAEPQEMRVPMIGACQACGHEHEFPQREPQEPDAYRYALGLASSIWSRHYKDTAPGWKPLDDLVGLLSQIDNMVAGLVRQEKAALAEQPEPPPESQTEAEQRSYTFGWFKALEKSREMQEALQIIATAQGKQ